MGFIYGKGDLEYTIDDSHMPDYLLITVTGQQSSAVMKELTEEIVTVMDEHVGPYEEFAPIIFDVSQATSQAISAGGTAFDAEFGQRLTKWIIVTGPQKSGGFLGKLTDKVLNMAPGIHRVEHLDEAIGVAAS